MVPLSKSGLAFGERGFESHPLRFFRTVNIVKPYRFFLRRGAGVADQARLESACRLWATVGSNPTLSAVSRLLQLRS